MTRELTEESNTALPLNKKPITPKNEQQFSKYLSYILRHHPEDIGLELLQDGWVDTHKLIEAINNSSNNKYFVALYQLIHIVDTDNKQRYSFKASKDNEYAFIRANQGHSIKKLSMNFKEVTPPRYLYHGTSIDSYNKIVESGEIKPMSRQMVHLSKDFETATNVGKRHGKPVILTIDTEKAMQDNKKFSISENGVYLVDVLNTKYIKSIQ